MRNRFRFFPAAALTLAALVSSCLFAQAPTQKAEQPAPAALATDPPADQANPASMQAFQIPSHDAALNAIAYVAAGAGPHPIVLVLHGIPGNEKNLDIAQAIRRAGWTAVYFDYRGSWGSPGAFSFSNSIEDTQAAIAWLREPAHAAKLRSDPKKIVLLGHSMGGFMAAWAGSHDPAILATGLISAADMASLPQLTAIPGKPQESFANLAKNLEAEDILPLAGCTGQTLAQELTAHQKAWSFSTFGNQFGNRPLLVITSNDGLAPAPAADALAETARRQGSKQVTAIHFATDHSYSDKRIAVETAVLNWLASLR